MFWAHRGCCLQSAKSRGGGLTLCIVHFTILKNEECLNLSLAIPAVGALTVLTTSMVIYSEMGTMF